MRVIPVTLVEANEYLRCHHRHNGAMCAAKFAVAIVGQDGAVHGVGLAGLPKARLLMSRTTLEVNRVCSDGTPNVCSMLYGALVRAGKALGYTRFVTYTLERESGVSLRASGWKPVATFAGGKWSEMRGTGFDAHDTGPKVRWEIGASEQLDISGLEADADRGQGILFGDAAAAPEKEKA